jgi:hypothetical protein
MQLPECKGFQRPAADRYVIHYGFISTSTYTNSVIIYSRESKNRNVHTPYVEMSSRETLNFH